MNCIDIMPTYIFEKPKTVPEVLDWLDEKYGQSEYTATIRAEVTRTLSRAEQARLDEKWPAATFFNMGRVPQSYPTWAMRNVSLETWREATIIYVTKTYRDYNGTTREYKENIRQGVSDIDLIDRRDADSRNYGKPVGWNRGRRERKNRRARGNSLKTSQWTDHSVNTRVHRQRAVLEQFAVQQNEHLEDSTTRLVGRPKIRQLREPKPETPLVGAPASVGEIAAVLVQHEPRTDRHADRLRERITRPAEGAAPAPVPAPASTPTRGYVANGYARLVHCVSIVRHSWGW